MGKWRVNRKLRLYGLLTAPISTSASKDVESFFWTTNTLGIKWQRPWNIWRMVMYESPEHFSWISSTLWKKQGEKSSWVFEAAFIWDLVHLGSSIEFLRAARKLREAVEVDADADVDDIIHCHITIQLRRWQRRLASLRSRTTRLSSSTRTTWRTQHLRPYWITFRKNRSNMCMGLRQWNVRQARGQWIPQSYRFLQSLYLTIFLWIRLIAWTSRGYQVRQRETRNAWKCHCSHSFRTSPSRAHLLWWRSFLSTEQQNFPRD